MKNNLFNKNVPISFNKEKQFTRNRNEGAQCMLINFFLPHKDSFLETHYVNFNYQHNLLLQYDLKLHQITHKNFPDAHSQNLYNLTCSFPIDF